MQGIYGRLYIKYYNVMKVTKLQHLGAAVAGLIFVCAAASCSKAPKFIGTWTATAPTSLQSVIPAASSATQLVSLDFLSGDDEKSGPMVFTSLIEASQPVQGDSASFVQPYQANISGTAVINGTWTYAGDDHDDLIISYDLSTLKVAVDPQGVSFSENLLTGAQQPMVDSLTNATAAIWQTQLTAAVKVELQNWSSLDDVKVENDGNLLKLEIKNAAGKDVDVNFRRVLGEK